MKIAIRGTSAAAWCCVHLLKSAGLKPVFQPAGRPGVPAIMLSDAALSLIRDIFGKPSLFMNAPRITRRVVKWGPGANPVALDHSAVVVSERDLMTGLQLDEVDPGQASDVADADFTLFAARPLPPGPVEHCFGSRHASAARIRLKDPRDSSTCWIESVPGGWLFLIPNAIGSGWLLSVGCSPEEGLSESTVIGERLDSVEPAAGDFPSGPRIVSPLGESNWLACGTAGLAFDPICGDGTAHAVREAILAAAVVRAISEGGDAPSLVAHYQSRLTAGFGRHLMACVDFYQNGERSPWWTTELESLRAGLEWCGRQMQNFGPFRYQLQGFNLQPVNVDKPSA